MTTNDDNLDFLSAVMAHTKEAAGLPPGWGDVHVPLSPEEELEDAPRPPRLRTGMTTAELLPYGDRVTTPDGRELRLERLTCPPIQAPGHGIDVCDPASLEWQGQPISVELRGTAQPVEVAVLRHATPRGDLIQPVMAVVGTFSKNTLWVEFPVAGIRLSIDAGCGAFIARGQVAAVAERIETLLPSVRDAGLLAVEVDSAVVGALFESGDGPGGYEVMLGRGQGGRPTALLVDLRVLPR
ncbi:hypothetical protein [Nocardioides baculatus]|uniref:Uncharacterized protein n=1 Tax=Nocardioides baculatus TaxID=2801337 RepID=A0ABS1L5F5_9ACTN|nr:hypothetical protein [Nocardioides baculatus]MBL0746840.1 hypothetical protein [Nocardioides baculatus]